MPRDFLKMVHDGVVLFDGAMGTMLYAKGFFLNRCYDELNISAPATVREIHEAYARAGADVIETNTFGANRFRLKPHGFLENLDEINYKGARLAREAAGEQLLVAGAVGPLGIRIEPFGPTSVDEAKDAFKEQIAALVRGGTDLICLETFSDLSEIQQAIKAVKEVAPGMPIVAQMTVGDDGNSLYGTPPEVFFARLSQWGADVVGVNCSVGPGGTLAVIEKVAGKVDKPLSAQPNAGLPRQVEGRAIYLASPEYMAEYAKRLIQAGARVVGGCCGTTPEHIKAIRPFVRALNPGRLQLPSAPPAEAAAPEVKPVPQAEKSAFARKIAEGRFVTSVEMTPPKGWDPRKTLDAIRFLKTQGVDVVNIPDGPRAMARMGALPFAVICERECGIETVLHYCCRDRNLLGMQGDLLGAYGAGLRNILLITGDPPKMGSYPNATAVFDVDAIGLTQMVNRLNHGLDLGGNSIGAPTGYYFGVGMNPGAIDQDLELRRFMWKVDAGAEFAITQPVFDTTILRRFLDKIEQAGIPRIPIIAGIWPLTSYRNAEFMNNEVPGASVPAEIRERLKKHATKEGALAEGISIAREALREIAPLVQGVQVSAPFGRAQLAIDVMKGLVPGIGGA